MFTVCPKCALTLSVTAADLRVAQGYVRCGRCSNVFNALARLSEDRQSAQAAAQAAAPPAAPPVPAAPPARPAADSLQAEIDADEPISEAALEFNPAAADVSKVFVAPPPSPEWTAATGTFKAIVLQSEAAAKASARLESRDATRQADATPTRGMTHRGPANPGPANREASSRPGAVEPQGEIELDADFLSATAAMRKLKVSAETAKLIEDEGNTIGPAEGGPADDYSTVSRPMDPPSRREGLAARQSSATTSPAQTQYTPQAPAAVASKSTPEPRVVPSPHAPATSTPFAFNLDSSPTASAEVARARVEGRPVVTTELGPSRTRAASNSATLWSAGAGALVILLVAQVVNHYRNDLAANAQLNRPITALYAAFGIHLTPRWDLHAYDVRQLGASADSASAGQIMVRASVKNGAHQPQPMPLLRVTLQDRFGNRIAARDVEPKNYLPRAIPPSSYLSAGQRIDAEIAFVDPGSNAVGFEIDACLPAPAGGTACANDTASR